MALQAAQTPVTCHAAGNAGLAVQVAGLFYMLLIFGGLALLLAFGERYLDAFLTRHPVVLQKAHHFFHKFRCAAVLPVQAVLPSFCESTATPWTVHRAECC